VAFYLRRLDLPVGPDDLVLEVGSGDNPYPRANVLVDRSIESLKRCRDSGISRAFVVADGSFLPFKTGSFNFVVAHHVLEHSDDPAGFLNELQRVATMGYIETPQAFREYIIPVRSHRLRIRADGEQLVITKKSSGSPDPQTMEEFRPLVASGEFRKFHDAHPEVFFLCFQWRNKISYLITNPETAYPRELTDPMCSGPPYVNHPQAIAAIKSSPSHTYGTPAHVMNRD